MNQPNLPSGRQLEELKARADERVQRRRASGGEQVSDEVRSRAGWAIALVAIALLAGAASVFYGTRVAIALVAILVIAIVLIRRMFR